MIINAENMTALEQTINGAFARGLATVPNLNIDYATTMFPSSGAMNLYPFMEDLGQWREWLGERVWNSLKYSDFTVLNRDWEKSYRLPKKRIDDNQYSTFPSMLELAAAGWPQLKIDQRVAVITGNAVGFDTKAIFANDHAFGDNAIDNLVGDALALASFEAAFLAASAWKFANGESCGTTFTHLWVGEKLRGTALELVADKTTTGGFNRNAGRVKVEVIPQFSGAYDDYWALLDCSKPIKPIMLQMRQEAEIVVDALPEHVKKTGNLDVMADGRMTAAPTFFHLMYAGIL